MSIDYLKMPENRVVITVAQTGALVTKKMNPNLPEQPDEIALSAYDCFNEGAAVVHIHARDKDGANSGDPEVFRKIHEKIRAKCDLILQDSTGGGANLSVEQRTGCIEACPEMASLNMGTLVRTLGENAGTPFMNTRLDIENFVRRMNQFGVKPEMEIYNLSMLQEIRILIEKGLLTPPYNVNLIVGMAYQGALEGNHMYLTTYLQYLPGNAYFNTLGVGKLQLTLGVMGMILGGNVRVGMEDNLYYRKGELAKSNAHLVARMVRIARELGKEPCTPEEARKLFGLKSLSNKAK
ncbi:MAG: 3-keto-5-aminohexanoate cleavage protein [Chloroflexi bacterium]|nr:3-keto-5-aminohexanoate cleavage protein [Chloroflexota bacterium]